MADGLENREALLNSTSCPFYNAGTIAEAVQSFLQQKQLDLRKLMGQGYDGTVTFAGKIS